jgi:glycosyltransferase involved in cell wall biosynthesis
MLGFLEAKNRSAVTRDQVEAWVREGVVEYLGETDDVRPFVAQADCVVLPSYREGIPRSLLEAASMGKPIITTDTPGCREVVAHLRSGYLVPARNVDALAEAMTDMAALSKSELHSMSLAARELVVQRFDERIVLEAYSRAIQAHMHRSSLASAESSAFL